MIRKGRRITAGAAWAGGCSKGEEERKAISRYLRSIQVVVVRINQDLSAKSTKSGIKSEQINFFTRGELFHACVELLEHTARTSITVTGVGSGALCQHHAALGLSVSPSTGQRLGRASHPNILPACT